MREEFRPAIEALQKDLGDLERKANEIKATINRLCESGGDPPLYADIGGSSSASTITSIKGDTFYGKVLTTAAREYLEMRKVQGLGPATPRDVYEALKKGGFAFETKNENNAITGVRATLRKNSGIFHRLPGDGGEYGLLAWYPNAKKPKETTEAEEEASTEEDTSADVKGSAAA
jgi:hypothetical protein